MTMRKIAGLREIAERYDGLIVDQFGVLHDGTRPYDKAIACLEALSQAGKRIVLLSNSGRRASENRERLADLGFRPAIFADVVTSGEVAWRGLAKRDDPFHAGLGRRCFVIADGMPRDFTAGLPLETVDDVALADFVLVIGIDTPRRTLESYDPILNAGIARGLPLLCANGDLVRLTRDGLQTAPGALGKRYAERGGAVKWYGKPEKPIFDACLAALAPLDRSRIIVVGDSLRHDIAGAIGAGLSSLYIHGGIDAGQRMNGPDFDAAVTDRAAHFWTELFAW